MPKSKNLCVSVRKNHKALVDLELPIYSLKIIDTMIPEKSLEKLKERNIDLKQIVDKVIESDYEPQILFEEEITDGEDLKKYKVWIK